MNKAIWVWTAKHGDEAVRVDGNAQLDGVTPAKPAIEFDTVEERDDALGLLRDAEEDRDIS